jgi:rhamnosyl/mannosyltransferase
MYSSAIIAATFSHFKRSNQIPVNYPESKKHVIQFGLDFNWLVPSSNLLNKVQIIKQKTQGRNLVFALGRHVEYKGFSFLIEAIKYTNSFLIIGGDGPLSPYLKEQVIKLKLTDRVHFTGKISSDEVAAHYHACDIFCLPSITPNEAFGIVQIEAMYCGKPVICTQLHNGVNEINPHNFTGITVPTKSVIGLADAINHLSSNLKKRQLLGVQAKKYAQEHFSISKSVFQHIDLYEKVIKSVK